MGISFTKDVEKERLSQKSNKLTWEYLETQSIVEALHKAKEMGWKDNKVQVRFVKMGDVTTYFVEPFEKNCGCRGMLKYKEYFN